jgi:hypothetical protein
MDSADCFVASEHISSNRYGIPTMATLAKCFVKSAGTRCKAIEQIPTGHALSCMLSEQAQWWWLLAAIGCPCSLMVLNKETWTKQDWT